MIDRLFLIDGHSLIFKMYYAFLRRPMINSKGQDTSILFGFTKYILELIEREKPTHLAVAFDPPGGTFRNRLYPEYKANRSETPQLVIEALEPLTEICKAMNIPVLMVMDYEADDVIGTVAKKYQNEDTQVFMVTPDKDYGQLIDKNIFQLKPGKAGGEDELIDIEAVCGKYGIQEPSQVIEILTLCGDSSDNVPGVKGVGEKGAEKLIGQFGTVENIYAALDQLTEKQRTMFEEARPHIGLSHDLVTIDTKVPVKISKEEMRIDKDFAPSLALLFEEYEFNSLKKHIRHIDKPVSEKSRDLNIKEVSLKEILKKAEKAGRCSIITEDKDSGVFSEIKRVIIGVAEGQECFVAESPAENIKSLIENKNIEKCGYGLKVQYRLLLNKDINMGGKLSDIELMHYLLSPETSHNIEILSKSYLGINLKTEEEIKETSLFDTPEEEKSQNRSKEAAASFLLYEKIREELEKADMAPLYDKIEEPLIRVLAKMELNGVKVEPSRLKDFSRRLQKEMEEIEARIREMTGEPSLNIASPKQIGQVLFEKMGLDPKAKKNAKGSYSTDENTLISIAHKHPVINEILEFRTVSKLLSTYIKPFPEYMSHKTGRIHTTFNQSLTATGRLSSSNPNLQNIPIRSDRGKEIRRAFVPSTEDGLILSADYSQIELRIMAHLSGDEHLINAFKEGIDVHSATAAKIFGTAYEEVSPEQRRIAKTANFGIMYGISAFGLSQRLQITRNEAKKLIDDYFAAFPAVQTFISKTIEQAREKGYAETIFGRRRLLPDISSKNATVRGLAERNAVNAPIQGSSADIIKLAMIGIDKRLSEGQMKSKMVLQVHDELVFDAAGTEVEGLRKIVTDEMENVVSLRIPLTIECNYGKNWLEAH